MIYFLSRQMVVLNLFDIVHRTFSCRILFVNIYFAIAIQQKTKYSHEAGMLFKLRQGTPIYKSIKNLGDTKDLSAKKLAKSLQLRKRFAIKFGMKLEED